MKHYQQNTHLIKEATSNEGTVKKVRNSELGIYLPLLPLAKCSFDAIPTHRQMNRKVLKTDKRKD